MRISRNLTTALALVACVGCGQKAVDAGNKNAKPAEPSIALETDAPPVPLGTPAPDIAVKGFDGKVQTLASLRGNFVLIDFWATRCPPCVAGLPETARLAKLKGLRVLAITDENQALIRKFLRKHPSGVTPYFQLDARADVAYNVYTIPAEFIVDPQGNLVGHLVGGHDESEIESALRQAGATIPTRSDQKVESKKA